MNSSVLRFVFVALFAIGLSLQAVAQSNAGTTLPTKPGAIKVGKVTGTVRCLSADAQARELKVGDIVIETDTITTDKGALVVLVFANGASVKLGSDTVLKIEEFKMDPLDEDVVVAKLEREPSSSTTKLLMTRGELVGDVKHLNYDKGSTFNITTPVGAAGIRGTTFRIVFRPSGDGKSFTFQLSTADGRVAFEGTVQAPADVSVPQGEELVVTAEATVDPTTGAVEVTKVDVPAATTTISPEASAQITQAVVTAITEAAQTVTITTTDQQQAATTDTNSGGTTGPTNTTPEETKSDQSTTQETTKSSENSNSSNTTPTDTTPTGNTNTPGTTPPGATQPTKPLTPGAGG
jgi:hypothetical protein